MFREFGDRRAQHEDECPSPAVEPRLQRTRFAGVTWNPIIDWTLEQVLSEVGQTSLRLHEAYTRYGSSRVSCAFCIMSSARGSGGIDRLRA